MIIHIKVQGITFISNERTESMRVWQKLKWRHNVNQFGKHCSKWIADEFL
jgi:hypothetical protein